MTTSTITLNGLTTHDYGTYYPYFAIRNDSGGVVYASTTDPECTPDTEGVVSIANGDGYIAANTDYDNTCLYLSGTGKVTIIAQHDKIFPFKVAQGGGGSGTASGSVVGLHIEKCVDEQVSGDISVSTLPYGLYGGSAVVLNNEIHIFGSGGNNFTKHYKFNGTSWESVSTLPYEFYFGSAVVLNNEIHILGSNRARTKHYKYNGTSWENVSTLPYEFYDGSAAVLNDEIHILGGSGSYPYAKYHYKYNGTSWENVSTLPYEFFGSSAVVLNGEIHILGSGYYSDSNYPCAKYHYKYNGTSWENVSTLPYGFYDGSAAVLNDEIHILGGSDSSRHTNHYLDRPDNRHIATMLPKGVHVLLSDNEDIIYASNAKRISSNIAEVTDTGYVELLAALTDANNIKGYLTFY